MTTANDKLDLYKVTQGNTTVYLSTLEAAQEARRALEALDPWGSIPFVKRVSMGFLEALRAIEENQLTLATRVTHMEAEIDNILQGNRSQANDEHNQTDR